MGGGSVMPITGPGGLQQHHNSHASHGQNSVDRRASGSFRVSKPETIMWTAFIGGMIIELLLQHSQ